MAKIPGPENIGVGTPNSGPMLNQTVDTSGLERGVGNLVAGLNSAAGSLADMAAFQKNQDDSLDIARAEAFKTEGFVKLGQKFRDDPDYATFTPRASEGSAKMLGDASNLIRDPNTRARWLATSQADRARWVGSVTEQASSLRDSTTRAAYLTTMDQNVRVASDPTVDPATREKAIRDNAGMISMGLRTRLLTADDGYKLRRSHLEGAEEQLAINQAQLDILNDPAMVMRNLGVPAGPAGGELSVAQAAVGGGIVPLDATLARQTAVKLNDPNFPSEDGDVKAYLSDPTINAKYAKQATALLTDRFKGDMTAAVIATAPGGDIKLAEKWVKSGHDESVLPEAVRQHYRQVMGVFAPQAEALALPVTSENVDLSTIDPPVLDRFEKLQAMYGKPLPVVPNGDADGDGQPDTGLTVDVSKLGEDDRKRLLRTASAMGFGGIGISKDTMRMDAGAPRTWGEDGTPDSVPAALREDADQHVKSGFPDIPASFAPVAPAYAALDFDKRLALYARAKAAFEQGNVAARASLETAVQNAPAAMAYNGEYTGFNPTANDFVAAYGGADGVQRWQAFSTAMDTASAMHDFRTMPSDLIAQTVAAATPTNTADLAGDQAKQFETLSTAAASILKDRKDDPAKYVMQAFPDVATAWEGAGNDPAKLSDAINMMDEAQKKLRISARQLLPTDMATNAVETFKNVEAPGQARIGAVTHAIGIAKTDEQKALIFKQLVKAGLPSYTRGAMAAMERGDQHAAAQLFRAALVDPDKLPGDLPAKKTEISTKITDTLFDNNGLAHVAYGLDSGDPGNFERATDDGILLTRGVMLRMMDGTAGNNIDRAIALTRQDIFGDKQVYSGTGFNVALDGGESRSNVQFGFGLLRHKVAEALSASQALGIPGMTPPPEAPPRQAAGDSLAGRIVSGGIAAARALGGNPDAAIAGAQTKARQAFDESRASGEAVVNRARLDNFNRDVLLNGHFVNYGEHGFAFMQPSGMLVNDPTGAAVVFGMDELRAAMSQRSGGDGVGGGGW